MPIIHGIHIAETCLSSVRKTVAPYCPASFILLIRKCKSLQNALITDGLCAFVEMISLMM